MVVADPFYLMVKHSGQTCKAEYLGPKKAVVSVTEDCVHSVDSSVSLGGKTVFSPSRSCLKHSLSDRENAFKLSHCKPSKEGDEVDFVQVKVSNNMYYVYCRGMTFVYGSSRHVECPSKVFKLPLTASFSLNGVTYKGQVMNLVYEEKEDPLLLEKVTWHLTPIVKWEEMEKVFPVFQPLDPNHWIHSDEGFWLSVGLAVIGVIVISGCITLSFIWCCMKINCQQQPNHVRSKNQRTLKMRNLAKKKKQELNSDSSSEISIHG